MPTHSDYDLKTAVQRTANAYARIANRTMGCKIQIPVPLDFDLCYINPKWAGSASHTMSISINMVLLQDYPIEIINDTVPHEIAHLVQFDKFDHEGAQTAGHGWEWQEIMRRLGKKPIKCHTLDVTRALKVHKEHVAKMRKKGKRGNPMTMKNEKMRMPTYVRKSKLPIEQVLADIHQAIEASKSAPMANRFLDKQKVTYDGELVKIASTRLMTFAVSGTTCSCCGLKASFFAIERNLADEKAGRPYHLNLWGVDSDGDEVLFTHDHTLARSLGGSDHIENTTTMCTVCNFKKSLVETKILEIQKIEQFIAGGARNTWINTNEINIFVRKSIRVHPKTRNHLNCFDIANVNAKSPGSGAFTRVFEALIPILKSNGNFDAIFVESVINESFRDWFVKKGFEPIGQPEGNWNALFYLNS